MGFIDFLIGLAKGLGALVASFVLFIAGSGVMVQGYSIIGGILSLLGFVSIAYFAYNRRQMSQKSY
jgi:hypothetical protein